MLHFFGGILSLSPVMAPYHFRQCTKVGSLVISVHIVIICCLREGKMRLRGLVLVEIYTKILITGALVAPLIAVVF